MFACLEFKEKSPGCLLVQAALPQNPAPKHWCSHGPHLFLYGFHLHLARLEGTRDRKGKSMDAELNELILMREAVRLHIYPSDLGTVATTHKCCWASNSTRLSEVFRRIPMMWTGLKHPSSLGLSWPEQKKGQRLADCMVPSRAALKMTCCCCYPWGWRSQKVGGDPSKDTIQGYLAYSEPQEWIQLSLTYERALYPQIQHLFLPLNVFNQNLLSLIKAWNWWASECYNTIQIKIIQTAIK